MTRLAQSAYSAAGARVRVRHVGEERQPVVIVDDATGIAGHLIEQASRTRLSPATSAGSHYPGILAPAPTAYLDFMVRLVLPLITAHFGTGPVSPVRARGNFSLVTTPPDALSPGQRLPHVDTADALQFATVHFLCPANRGGTGFFRHRATGFETIDSERLPAYNVALDRELAASSPPPAYIGADGHALFAAIGEVAAMPDRLIL